MQANRITTLLLLILISAVPASSEEAVKHVLAYKPVASSIIEYGVAYQSKTLMHNSQTGEAIVFALTFNSDVSYALLPAQANRMSYVEQKVFRSYNVDEATSNGLPLDEKTIRDQTESEYSKVVTNVFSFGSMSTSGEPDSTGFDDSMDKLFSLAAANILYIPEAERTIGEEWIRSFSLGKYIIKLHYSLEGVKDGIAHVDGLVEFVDLPADNPLASSLRGFTFTFDLDIKKKLTVNSNLSVIFRATADKVTITRQISETRKLTGVKALTAAESERCDKESAILRRCTGLVKEKNFPEVAKATEAILVEGGSYFDKGIREFLSQEVYSEWPIDGRKVENLFFTDWVNGNPLKMQELKGKIVLLGFFDPDVPQSTRIWPAWDDWSECFSSKGLVCIAATGVSKEKLDKYLGEMSIKHLIARDGDGIMTSYFKVKYVPCFIVLNREGKVVLQISGRREMLQVTKKLEEFFGPMPER